jgi:hypothetical protein
VNIIKIIESGLTFGQVVDRILADNSLRAYCEFDEETYIFVDSEGYLCWGGAGQEGNQINLYMFDNEDDYFRYKWTLFKAINKENKINNITINITLDNFNPEYIVKKIYSELNKMSISVN